MKADDIISIKRDISTAILVDGGFYRKRAYYFWGEKSPKDRADELYDYCMKLLYNTHEQRYLYRIFYYDCPPVEKNVYNPLTKKTIDLAKSDEYKWTNEFFKELKSKRKVALRMGRLSENSLHYNIKPAAFKKLVNGQITINDLTENDLKLNLEQKGVDMRVGIDISSLSFKKQVDQIILIAGDSDFVPAAKQSRREGIDFILAPMGATIKPDLYEHIDGLINRPIKKVVKEDVKNET